MTTDTDKQPKVRLGRNYWRLWTASVTSNLGDGIAFIAYPWLASAVTRDPVLIVSPEATSSRLPPLTRFSRQPCGPSDSPSTVTKAG